MNAKPHTFIVRVWLEPNQDGPGLWRASVLDTSSQERRYFANPEDLAHFLQQAEGVWLHENATDAS